MNLYQLLFVLVSFTFVVPIHVQAESQARINVSLEAASKALDHYRDQIAPTLHCEEAIEKTLRDTCWNLLRALDQNLHDAREKIADYRRLPNPKTVDLYDIQQVFQGIMTAVERFGYEPERYGEHFRPWHVAIYNNFVKITLWLGEEVRSSIRGECGHT